MMLRKGFGVLLVILLANVVVSAYTLVMRDGRRVQIPDTFVVTNSTLTYQVAEDIQVTVQLASIDIAATHRLNNDQRLINRPESISPSRVNRASRTITNLDLETYRTARVESELAYEKRRKELGLPSIAEQQRQLAETAERARETALNTQANEAQAENYWRQRADELRGEMNATDARIQSIRRLLDELPPTYSFGAFTTVLPANSVGLPIQRTPRRSVFVAPGSGRNNGPRIVHARRFDGRRQFNRFGQGALLAIPFQQSDYGSDRLNLTNQLNELTVYRAGLQSRWRDLEEEARRAGAYPGWLR
jgi:hypothetical protein